MTDQEDVVNASNTSTQGQDPDQDLPNPAKMTQPSTSSWAHKTEGTTTDENEAADGTTTTTSSSDTEASGSHGTAQVTAATGAEDGDRTILHQGGAAATTTTTTTNEPGSHGDGFSLSSQGGTTDTSTLDQQVRQGPLFLSGHHHPANSGTASATKKKEA